MVSAQLKNTVNSLNLLIEKILSLKIVGGKLIGITTNALRLGYNSNIDNLELMSRFELVNDLGSEENLYDVAKSIKGQLEKEFFVVDYDVVYGIVEGKQSPKLHCLCTIRNI